MLGVVAAPEVPVLAGLVVGLGALLAWATLRGLRFSWLYTIGYLLEVVADALDFSVLGKTLRLGGPIRRANRRVLNAIEVAAAGAERAVGYLFHAVATILAWQARELAGLAHDVLDWAESLRRVVMPRLTRAMILAAFPYTWLARRVAALVRAHAIPATRTVIARTTRPVIQRVTRIVKATAGAVVIPGVLWHLFPRVRDAVKDITNLRHRVRGLEKAVGATAALALVATGLRKLGLRCLTGRNGRTIGKRLCGVDPYLLQSVLTDATLIIGTLSIVELTRGTQRLLPAITDATGYLVREAPDAWNDAPREVLRDALAILPDFPG